MPVFKKVSPAAIVAAAATILLSLACTNEIAVRAAVKADKDRKAAPNFTLKDVNGDKVQLADYKGKVVLLDFWATWCGPCKIEIPWFMEFEQQYKNKGFAVLGVSMDDDGWSVVKPYLEKLKVNYRIVLGNDKVGELYGGVDSLPTTFLIDREGRIASTHVGLAGGKEDFRNEIVHLLGSGTSTAAVRPPAGGTLAFFARSN